MNKSYYIELVEYLNDQINKSLITDEKIIKIINDINDFNSKTKNQQYYIRNKERFKKYYEANKSKTKEIHYHQIQGLNEWNKYDGITCGFIIEFRQIEKTVFIHIEDFNKIMAVIPKTSFSYNDIIEYKINHTVIEQEKARTRFTYKIDEFLRQQ